MLQPSFSRSRLRGLITPGVAAAVVAVATAVACSSTTEPRGKVVYGPSQSLGQGTARVYVSLDGTGKPVSLGVALSEGALNALPQTPLPGGGMSAANLILALPPEAKTTGFDHAMVDWNPMGHEPAMVYTLPHFDFHFYTVSEAAQMAILPSDPEFAAKLDKLPAEAYRPAGNIKLPGGVPMMGAHWADPTSPELAPPPNNKIFTRTFLYGSVRRPHDLLRADDHEGARRVGENGAGEPHRVADQASRELRAPGLLPHAVHDSVGRRGEGVSHRAGWSGSTQLMSSRALQLSS